jgi:hypothetical protein
VKTAGVDDSILKFTGPAKVYESQDAAVTAILTGQVVEGDVVLIRYEGPKGGPGMQEMLYPTSYLKSKGLGKACALVTDGRFSGGSSGLSIGHVSPEAAEGATLPWSRPATGSPSTFRPHHRRSGAPMNSPAAARRWKPRAPTPGSRPSRVRARFRSRFRPMPR